MFIPDFVARPRCRLTSRPNQRFWCGSSDRLEACVAELKEGMKMDGPTGRSEPVSDRQFTVTRVFDAPARLVFLAHSRPEHVCRWIRPGGWPLSRCEMDFRVGGTFRVQMTSDASEPGPSFEGTYLQIEPNRKIVYDSGFGLPSSGRFRVEVLFDEFHGQTTLAVTTSFLAVAMKEEYLALGMAEGMASAFEQLCEVVEDFKAWELK
jgi:uncharacterized protein YndB with AHSA1/START domain